MENPIIIWFLVAIALFIVEAATVQLVTIWFSVGALVSAIVAAIIPEQILIQFIIFILISIVLLIFTRDIAMRKLKVGQFKTNVDSLMGKKAMVTKTIEEYNLGEIKLDGKYWTAKSESGLTYQKDDIAEVVDVSGVKLIVK